MIKFLAKLYINIKWKFSKETRDKYIELAEIIRESKKLITDEQCYNQSLVIKDYVNKWKLSYKKDFEIIKILDVLLMYLFDTGYHDINKFHYPCWNGFQIVTTYPNIDNYLPYAKNIK